MLLACKTCSGAEAHEALAQHVALSFLFVTKALLAFPAPLLLEFKVIAGDRTNHAAG